MLLSRPRSYSINISWFVIFAQSHPCFQKALKSGVVVNVRILFVLVTQIRDYVFPMVVHLNSVSLPSFEILDFTDGVLHYLMRASYVRLSYNHSFGDALLHRPASIRWSADCSFLLSQFCHWSLEVPGTSLSFGQTAVACLVNWLVWKECNTCNRKCLWTLGGSRLTL